MTEQVETMQAAWMAPSAKGLADRLIEAGSDWCGVGAWAKAEFWARVGALRVVGSWVCWRGLV
ncbi:MAG: hypothetical protein ACRD0V_15380 [Acidimicrobiales bacterium]